MTKYHINPTTGDVLVCRAKLQCRYGADASHYESQELARAAFEVQSSHSKLSVLRKNPVSRGARILMELDHVEQAMSAAERVFLASDGDRDIDPHLIDERKRLLKELEHNLDWDDTDAPAYDDTVRVKFETRTFNNGETRVGYDKNAITPDAELSAIYAQMDEASAEWIRRLSTAEVRAIVTYNVASSDYSVAVEGGTPEDFDPRVIKYLHTAVAKAPRSEHTFTVYAGISQHRCLAVREMGEAGELNLSRVQSATVNPGQINAFMRQSDPYRDGLRGTQDKTALEIRANRVASLSAFNVHRDEMEVLIAPGNYQVVGKQHDLIYTWDTGAPPGRKPDAETTYTVEPR